MEYTGERMIPEYNKGEDMYLEHFARYFFAAQFVNNKNVLDIACGSGYGSYHLLNSGAKKIIGVDISAETVNYCKEKYQADNLNFLIGDVKMIPQENNTTDVAVSFETIEHVDEDSQIKFIEEIKRVLTPDGLFIVSTPNSQVHPKGNHFHIHELDFEEFKNILNKNFTHVAFFYQDTVESSYIYSEESLIKKIKDDNKKFKLNEKTSEMSVRESMYIVAVCSDKKFEDINELICLSDIKPCLNLAKKNEEIKYFNLDLNKKKEEIESLNLNLDKKKEEIESLNLNLDKKKEEIESLNLNLDKKKEEIESLNRLFELKNRELLFVTTSLSWRIILFIKKITKIIIPDSSLGNKITLSVFRFFRKIFRNCIKYFLIILNLSLLIKAFLRSVAEGKIKYKSIPNLFKQTVWNIFNNGLAQTIIIIKEFNKKNNETDRYNNNYYRWIRGVEAPFIKNLKKQKERLITGFEYKPKISILVPVYNSDEIFFRKAVFSVINQWYQNWELCIVDDKSKTLSMKIILDELRGRKDDRIKIDVRETNGGMSKATNQAAKMASGDFLAFLDHDDELEPQALLLFVLELQKNKNIDISYSDSDKIDANGYRYSPEFKPDWSPELLLSVAYTSHFRIIRKELFNLVGGLREDFDGSQDYDLMLRITEKTNKVLHIPWVLYHWRAVKGSLALSAEAKPFAQNAGLRALQAALERRKIPGRAVIKKGAGTSGLFKIDFDQNLIKDKISIIIPTKDALPVLKKCITSIKKLTSYPNYEIVVINNNSEKEETIKYLESADLKVLNIPTKRFNFSYINNKAVEMVDSEYVVFLNNDTEIINPKWLLELIGTMKIRDSIGAVGGKLLYQDNTIQQAGNIIDLDHKLVAYYVQDNNKKYIYSDLLCNYSAVGAACMIVKKSFFQKIGGFNEIELPASYDDVDLCIRFLLANHVCVYNPEVLLYHHESFTRKTGYIAAENNYIINNYKKYFLSGDPYFNRHFETFNNDFTLKEK